MRPDTLPVWRLVRAMAAVFLPVAGAAAASLGAGPVGFLWPVALAASAGFMLPVATPPNAIITQNPPVTRVAMLRAGAAFDMLGSAVTAVAGLLIAPLML